MTGSNNIHSNGSSDSSGRGNDVTKMMTFEANKKSTGLAYVIWFFLVDWGYTGFIWVGR